MAYEKQGFVEGQVLKAEHLNYIEEGIVTSENEAAEAVAALTIPVIIYSETEPAGQAGAVWQKPVVT